MPDSDVRGGFSQQPLRGLNSCIDYDQLYRNSCDYCHTAHGWATAGQPQSLVPQGIMPQPNYMQAARDDMHDHRQIEEQSEQGGEFKLRAETVLKGAWILAACTEAQGFCGASSSGATSEFPESPVPLCDGSGSETPVSLVGSGGHGACGISSGSASFSRFGVQ